jgi:hypothetical protein
VRIRKVTHFEAAGRVLVTPGPLSLRVGGDHPARLARRPHARVRRLYSLLPLPGTAQRYRLGVAFSFTFSQFQWDGLFCLLFGRRAFTR